jgi:hypothetical protein
MPVSWGAQVRTVVDFPMSGFDRGWVRGCSLVFSGPQMP